MNNMPRIIKVIIKKSHRNQVTKDQNAIEETKQNVIWKHSVHPPFPFWWGGVEPTTKFSKKGGGLTRS